MINTWREGVEFTFKTRHKWRVGNAQRTMRINCNHISRIVGDDYLLSDFNRSELRRIAFELEDYGLSDSTINRVMTVVGTVLRHCNDEEVINLPVPRIPKREEPTGRPHYFTKEQVNSICQTRNTALSDLVRFASLTGGRLGELMSLQVKDIDLEAGLIYFGGRPEFKTKTGDWRTVPIVGPTRDLLTRRIEGIPKDVHVFGDQWLSKDQVLRKFKQRTKELGIEKHYVFHCLRHSFATWHIENNTPIRVLMDLMGHKQIATTLRYAKATDKARVDAMSSFIG